ncbi:glycosyltransferase [Ferrimicrobium sp.]|uniref:glycosyltransferase n=1 Tax=Ferrimicrobium sp. TaxID=2926050 RepID=UPI00261375A2|nr:glycosyltransferase [Ferrimicrobium sp.]
MGEQIARESVQLTRQDGQRLGSLIVDPRGTELLAVAGDLPCEFATDHPGAYGPLIAAGVLVPSSGSLRTPTISVVIPARNPPPDSFATLVGNLVASPWVDEVIVVDDASQSPIDIDIDGIVIVRNTVSLGPGAARNLGAQKSTNEVLLFIDADIVSIDEELFSLLKLLTNHQIVALAPRVIEEGHLSPLDLGPSPTMVDGKHLNHLPGAVLAIDRRHFEAVGGFGEDLRLGEDVDLINRLRHPDHLVIYAPNSVCVHHHQPLFTRLIKTATYGYSVGHLRRRTDLTLIPQLRDAPSLAWVVFAPFTTATLAALNLTNHLSKRLARSQQIKASILLLDRQFLANASLIVRQLGLPMALSSLVSGHLRRSFTAALIIEVLHQGITATLYDLAYSIGLWLSIGLEN